MSLHASPSTRLAHSVRWVHSVQWVHWVQWVHRVHWALQPAAPPARTHGPGKRCGRFDPGEGA